MNSRFGKFVRLFFDSEGGVRGAGITHYLLEKTRAVIQPGGERSYHIFYQVSTT